MLDEVVIGVDAHKRSHTLVAVDQLGRKLGERTVATTSEAHLAIVEWAGQWPRVRFAVEDCRHVTRRLERDLLAAGYAVVRVPTHLMAAARRTARQPGKSDPIDALAVAHAALREPGLPAAQLDGPTREVKLLVDHRHHLVVERTELINRLRWHVHELDPGLQVPSRGMRRYCVMDRLAARLACFDGLVARLARELVARCRELTVQINDLERELRDRVRVLAPQVANHPRLRGAGRGDNPRRNRWCHQVSFQGRLCALHRNRPHPGVVGQHLRQGAPQPRREPYRQLRPAHDRDHPGAWCRTRQDLCGQAHRRREDPYRSDPAAAPPTVRRHLPSPARRRTTRNRTYREHRRTPAPTGGLT